MDGPPSASDWGNVIDVPPAPSKRKSTGVKAKKKEVSEPIPDFLTNQQQQETPLSEVPLTDLLKIAAKEEEPEYFLPEKTARKATRSKSPKKKVNFVSEESLSEQANRRSVFAIYNELFEPGVRNLHNARKKEWPEDVDISLVEKEIKDIQSSFACASPTLNLSNIWVSMLGAVETFGNISGTPFPNLAKTGTVIAGTPQAQTVFREILMKYPMMRQTLAMGDIPELKLLFMTLTVFEASYKYANSQGMQQPQPPRPE